MLEHYLLPGGVTAGGVVGGASSSFFPLFPRGFLPPFGVPDRDRWPLGLLGVVFSSSGGGVGSFASCSTKQQQIFGMDYPTVSKPAICLLFLTCIILWFQWSPRQVSDRQLNKRKS